MWENFDIDIYSSNIIPYSNFTISNSEYGNGNCLAATGGNDFVFAHDESDTTLCTEFYFEFDYDDENNNDCMDNGECEYT